MSSMTGSAGGDCPGWETLVSYFQMELPEAEAAVVDEHFGHCDLCVDISRAAHARALALDNWTAASHGAAWKRKRIAEAVEEISGRPDERLAEQLKEWGRNLRQATAGALELLGDLKLATAGLADIVRPGGWRFEPAGAVRDVAGSAAAGVMVSQTNGLRVEVLAGGELRIVAPEWPKDQTLPSVMVIDKAGRQPAIILELTQEANSGVCSGTVPAMHSEALIIFLTNLGERM